MEISHHLSAVLVAEFAASALAMLAAITDPAERCARGQEILHTLARVRCQDTQAGRLAIERERQARERIKERRHDESRETCAKIWEPLSDQFKRDLMADHYARPDFVSQMMATQEAESLLRGEILDAAGPDDAIAPDQTRSN